VGAQSSGLTTILAVLVFLSVILALSISVSIAIIIFMKRKKVETIQDYTSPAIELLTQGHPEYLPPYPQPHLPQQLGHEPKAMNPVTMCDQY